MSEQEQSADLESRPPDQPPGGPNLNLIYTLIGLAVVIALVLASFIVLPFYQRR